MTTAPPMLVLEGHRSVEAALEGDAREVQRVLAVRPGDRRLGRLRALARDREVLIDAVDRAEIDDRASGRTHGGVVALVGPRRTRALSTLLSEAGERPLLVLLDGVEDPFNYGQAVRSLFAAGVDGLVGHRDWDSALPIVTRASAGATELMPTAVVASVAVAADEARAAGLRVLCATTDRAATELHDTDLRGGLLVLVGGERRGVTRSFVGHADGTVRIGYGRERAPSLGAAAAAAIVAFEALRQRRGSS